MALRWIIADQQDGKSSTHVAQRSRCVRLTCKSRGESREVGRAVVINVVGAQHGPRKLLQKVVLFVGRALRTNHGGGGGPGRSGFFVLGGNQLKRFVPRRGNELSIAFDQRPSNAIGTMREVEGITSLDAEEVAVDTALVAIIAADDLHACIRTTNT